MKKILIAIFVLSLVATPATTRAGFFDFFKVNQSAQVKSAVTGDNLILQVQQALTAQGYYKGELSGVVRARTQTAIKAFQKANGLPVTGLLDQTTVSAILKSGGGAQVSYPSRICNESTVPWIKVLSPNGGETFTDGQQANVTWSTCNVPEGTTIQLHLAYSNPSGDGGSSYNLLAPTWNTPNDGNQMVILDTTSDRYGQNFKIKAVAGCSSSVDCFFGQDESNEKFFINGTVGEGCEEEDVVVSIAGDTPQGVQSINQFNVLKFTVENESNCDVLLEDLKVAYMTTDGKPYFDEIQILDEQNNFLGENDELQTDPNFNLGDTINVSFSSAIQIDDGDSKDFILRLVNYNQPVFDNTVPYSAYKHKYLLFGFTNEDTFDFKWTTPQSPSFGGTLDPYNDGWGERVRIPVTSLQI